MDYLGNLNLLRLNNAAVVSLKGKTATKVCIVIPCEDNDIYLTQGDDGKHRGAYLSCSVAERREPSERGHTHYARLSYSSQFREAHPKETEAPVYFGDFKPFKSQPQSTASLENANAPALEVSDDELPF
ncbi:MAG: hypothetical protein MSH18_03740 [Bacteroidales bacterium]|nr:hypothetical protein [Bacteroidales bacterium]